MMEAGRTWLLSVLVTCVLCAAADGLMPSGGVRQVGRLVCGLVLLVGSFLPVPQMLAACIIIAVAAVQGLLAFLLYQEA